MSNRTVSRFRTVIRAITPALILGLAIVGSIVGRPEIAAGAVSLLGWAQHGTNGATPSRPAPARPRGGFRRPMVH